MRATKPSAKKSSRQRALDAAAKLFGEAGFNATSIGDIQRESGVLRGSLYFHFPSKEALGLEVLAAFFRAVAAALADALRKDGSPIDALSEVFESIPGAMETHGFRGGCLLGSFGQELSGSENFRKRVQARFDDLIALVAALLSQARQRGELSADLDPKAAARVFVCSFHGALIELRVYRDRRVYDECMGAVLRLLRRPS
ncbi:MAG: TetR family transcriptional regulator C-terminal domain-containing protein [Elusimicrobia bacterium]|nr:TetR family transcriptional regulator C-terminal domain-containing protein [Elusimicrobiota bacterium]